VRFPETPREGTEAHASALDRMTDAREAQRHSRDASDAARGTPSEPARARDLAAADEQLAAREAWVSWIERGY